MHVQLRVYVCMSLCIYIYMYMYGFVRCQVSQNIAYTLYTLAFQAQKYYLPRASKSIQRVLSRESVNIIPLSSYISVLPTKNQKVFATVCDLEL